MEGRPLAICFGTRPQVIKASILIEAAAPHWPLLTVDTGQHYDYEMNAIFFEQLGVGRPSHFLEIGSGSHADQTAAILTRLTPILEREKPWAAVVIGDTNSTLGCALAAAYLHIPIVHIEAGMRAENIRMAEERNRRITDALSDLLCAPSQIAMRQLEQERQPGRVVFTGDIAYDVLCRQGSRAVSPAGIPSWPLPPGAPYALATLHRAELTDNMARFEALVHALDALDLPVVLAAHPRIRALLDQCRLRAGGALHVIPPLGYLEMLGANRDASVLITDSGGLQREAYWLGTPCITLRRETEWGETVALGANLLLDPDRAAEELPGAVKERVARRSSSPWDRSAYGDGSAASRVVSAVREWATVAASG
jgi:UDP-N-acetylglucosamine 2-epimerase